MCPMKRLLAAFIFFTRLPFWRMAMVPAECFKHVVPYWPIVGWLTGGVLAGTLWLLAQVLPMQVAWVGAIMKDSHIGTYGVVGLILYFLLWTQMTVCFPLVTLCAVAFCADVYAKWCASHIVNLLPYARKKEESKAKVTYSRMTLTEFIVGLVGGGLPLLFMLPAGLWWACLYPPVIFLLLCGWMKQCIGGYTGDCCGAVFLLCELSFYIGVTLLIWK